MTDVINKEKILEHAKKLVSEGKFDRAVGEYERLLQADPDDLRIKIKIAELYVKRKQIQDAIRMYMDVAKGYTEGSFYLKAATVYKSILRLNPSLTDVNISLSELYEKMGLAQDALYQYQIVANALEQKGDKAGLLKIREKMVQLDPDNTAMKIRLAETYQLQGETEKSVDMYEALAKQLKDSGSADQLIELYNKIISHRPEKTDFVDVLCKMYYKRGEWKEILKRMETAKTYVDGKPELLSMQAEVYARLNQTETAKKKYKELTNLLIGQGDTDGAISAFENILFLSPEDEGEIKNEAESVKSGAFAKIKERVEERHKRLADEEKKREDEETLDRSDETSIKEADSSYDLGLMYKQIGLKDEARIEFDKAYKLYQRLNVPGARNQQVIARLKELELFFGYTAKAVTATEVKIQPPKKQEAAKKEKEPPKKASQKKISFV